MTPRERLEEIKRKYSPLRCHTGSEKHKICRDVQDLITQLEAAWKREEIAREALMKCKIPNAVLAQCELTNKTIIAREALKKMEAV